MSNTRTGVMSCPMPVCGSGTPGDAPSTSARKHAGGQVAVTAIAHDEDDGGVLDFLRDTQRDGARAAGRNPGEDSFLAGETTGRVLGIGLRHILDAIDAAAVEYL